MPKISAVITSLIEIQEVIGDREVVLTHVDNAELPLLDAHPLGINIIDTPSGPNGHCGLMMQDDHNSRS